jgi:hypothetical protein
VDETFPGPFLLIVYFGISGAEPFGSASNITVGGYISNGKEHGGLAKYVFGV